MAGKIESFPINVNFVEVDMESHRIPNAENKILISLSDPFLTRKTILAQSLCDLFRSLPDESTTLPLSSSLIALHEHLILVDEVDRKSGKRMSVTMDVSAPDFVGFGKKTVFVS